MICLGEIPTGENPPLQPQVMKDLLTGAPVVQTLSSTPLLPLQPTTAGSPVSPSVPPVPFSVRNYIDKIHAMERDRNAKIDELMDEDFESIVKENAKTKVVNIFVCPPDFCACIVQNEDLCRKFYNEDSKIN